MSVLMSRLTISSAITEQKPRTHSVKKFQVSTRKGMSIYNERYILPRGLC